MQLNNPVRKLLYVNQAQRHLSMPRRKEGNAFPDEGWHYRDDELVDRALVQEGTDDLASAHQPDALAGLCAQMFGKRADRLADELDAGGHGRRGAPPREHIVEGARTKARSQLEAPVVGLASEDLRIR